MSGPERNSNEGVLQIPQSFRTGASSSDSFISYPIGMVLRLCREAVGVFYNRSLLYYTAPVDIKNNQLYSKSLLIGLLYNVSIDFFLHLGTSDIHFLSRHSWS